MIKQLNKQKKEAGKEAIESFKKDFNLDFLSETNKELIIYGAKYGYRKGAFTIIKELTNKS